MTEEIPAHNAVYYVFFSHRDELEFSSVLDANNTIALPDEDILAVLRAHVRASVISCFSLRANFTLFPALEHYFSYQESLGDMSSMYGMNLS